MRDESGLFIAEGTKLVLDLLPTFNIQLLYATKDWENEHGKKVNVAIQLVTDEELKKISSFTTPQGVLAVFKKNEVDFKNVNFSTSLVLALDEVQDPGNLGTIIRIADWFGINDIFCSAHCADVYGHKTIQATMGALARVRVHYVDLHEFITFLSPKIPIYGTFMDGDNIYSQPLTPYGMIVMGNEGNGISHKIGKLVTNRLLIPNFPKGIITSESLNVGVATALVCGEFRRRQI